MSRTRTGADRRLPALAERTLVLPPRESAELPPHDPPSQDLPSGRRDARQQRRDQRREDRMANPGPIRRFLREALGDQDQGLSATLLDIARTYAAADKTKAPLAFRALVTDIRELQKATNDLERAMKGLKVDKSVKALEDAAPGTLKSVEHIGKLLERIAKTLPTDSRAPVVGKITAGLKTECENFARFATAYREYDEARRNNKTLERLTKAAAAKAAWEKFASHHQELLKTLGLPASGALP